MTRRRPRQLLAALVAAAAVLLAAAGAWQAAAPPQAVTPQERAVALERSLRCPTCQGLSIADSASPIAAGMRRQVEQQLAGGASTAQVRAYFTARYSDWILLDPPRRGLGWLVWIVPPVLLLGGLVVLRRTLRRQLPDAASAPEDVAAAEAFAADPPPDADLPEPVAAALADIRAARVEADLDPTGHAGVDDALTRLSSALRDRPVTTASAPRVASNAGESTKVDDAAAARGRAARYALPVAAILFTGLLGATLARTIGARPATGLPTGNLPTPAAIVPTPSAPGLTALEQATRAHPADARTWLTYATALNRAGRLTDAEPAYRKALALNPGSLPATEQLAWVLIRGGSSSEALSLLEPLAQRRADDPQVVLLLGLAQRDASRPQADATLRHYLSLAPDSAAASVVQTLLGQSP